MAAPVTHFEINALDGKRSNDFYSNLFGWNVQSMPEMNYGMIDTGVKMGINGAIGQVDQGKPPSIVFYVQVEDVQAFLDKAVSLGGKVVRPLTEIPNMVTYAMLADIDGNVVGLVKGPQSPPTEAKPKKAPARKKRVVRKAKKTTKKAKKGRRK
jgi:predicted enzyme related to lactoylglutathione lyase